MFSQIDNTIVNYHYGTVSQKDSFYFPYTTKQRHSYNLLSSAYTVVRTNCEDACSQKILSDMTDELKKEYRDNSKIGQMKLKSLNNDTQISLDSCIRRCFGKKKLKIVKRLTNHFGKDIQDYIYATAFEYQQSDFHFFDINNVSNQAKTKNCLSFPHSDHTVADKLINF
jgi:hypothetical protein